MKKTSKETKLTISKLAEKAGVNLQTIRYYERLNLLPSPKRSKSGYRLYDEDYVSHIKFIKNAQNLDFKLKEIRELMKVKRSSKALGKEVKKIIQMKIDQIDLQIKDLKATSKYLKELDKSCSGRMNSSCCPILKTLES